MWFSSRLKFFSLICLVSLNFLILVSSSFGAPTVRAAKQVKFTLVPSAANYKYSYLWRDAQGKSHLTQFSLHKNDVNLGMKEFSRIGPDDDVEIARKLQVIADKIGRKVNAQISVTQEEGQFSLDMKGPNVTPEFFQDVYNQLQEEQSWIIREHLKRRYYDVELSDDAVMIRPDYNALVKRYRPVGEIVGKALRRSGPKDNRGLVEHALGFIQAIPYIRGANEGADFQTPIGLFTDNEGDCDTKAVALGSVLDSWGIKYVFLLMTDHLFMGIEVPKKKGDRSFSYGGKSYILAEPAGIGFLLGAAYPESLRAFSKGDLEVIRF